MQNNNVVSLLPRTLVAIAYIMAAIISTSALAANGNIMQACQADIKKYCSGVQPGGGRIALCLKPYSSTLSSECNALVIENTNPLGECFEKVKSETELQVLKGKIELVASNDPPFDILANNSFPKEDEKIAISLWMGERQKCLEANEEWRRSKFSAAVIAHWDNDNENVTSLALDLYNKKISYGDFAKTITKMHKDDKAFVTNLNQQQQQAAQQINQQQQDATQQKNMDIGSCTLVAQRAGNRQQELVNEQNAKGCNASNAKCGILGALQGIEIVSARNKTYNACMSAKGW